MSETITLLVHGAFYQGDAIGRRILTAEKKENLLAVLKRGGLYLHDCSGNGTCGKCKVQFCKSVPLPTAGERALLSTEELRAGVRLACRHAVGSDAELVLKTAAAPVPDVVGVLPGPEPAEGLKAAEKASGTGEELCAEKASGTGEELCAEKASGAREALCAEKASGTAEALPSAGGGSAGFSSRKGKPLPACDAQPENVMYVAVDIGTTTIAMRGMRGGQEVGAYAALNPQHVYGADVVSRIRAGMQGHAEDMRRQILRCLEDGITLITKQCAETPEYMVIAANTTMVHLLCGDSVEPLSAFPFEPVNIRPQQIAVAGIPAYIICGISAFVGGDIVSGMAAMGLHNASNLQLFIDLGTNGEIVLGKKGKFLCSATAAGPAFEGNASADLMGADLIQIAASLLDEGLMDAHGLLCEPYFTKGIDRRGAHITQESIRELQKAKAAVAAGIELLLEEYGASAQDVTQVMLAGGFGYYLKPDAAVKTGLLSKAFEGRVRAVGNTALQGACLIGSMLQNRKESGDTADMGVFAAFTTHLKKDCVYLNLAEQESFEKKYISNLDFPS